MDEDDQRAIAAERARLGRVKATRRVVWASLLQQVEGRKFCYELLEKGHIFVTSFRDNPLLMAFAEGERNYALQINADMVAADPDNYSLMLKEASARKENSNA